MSVEEEGWFERIALKHVYYHMWNRWPVQVRCMQQGTQSQCMGTTQRDGMGREEGLGFGTGGHMYVCGWFMSTYGKNHHNIVKSRQEYWSGLPFPSPGDLPNPGNEPGSPALQADALTSEPPGKLCKVISLQLK